MTNTIKTSTSDFDVIYLSYDEPNAEQNWADLVRHIPWAKRVHGVKGFDAAHKACASKSQTDNFITIDGDNRIDPTFFDQDITINPDFVYSWGAKNHVNGLIYGNGGMKLWPKKIVENMQTHESNIDGEGLEFCWKLNYYQMNDWYSTSYNNKTPYQAFRTGFREGVKLSLDSGRRVRNLNTDLWQGNIKRLKIWMSVGADVDNGVYSIYGSRLGCHMCNLTDFDLQQISDYDWFENMWHTEWLQIIEDASRFKTEYNRLRDDIINNLNFDIVNLGAGQSKFFKDTLENPSRQGLTVPEGAIKNKLMNDTPNNKS